MNAFTAAEQIFHFPPKPAPLTADQQVAYRQSIAELLKARNAVLIAHYYTDPEIQALAAAGYQEAVLTGVHLGSYGHDFGNQVGLRELVQAILQHTDIPRLRLSSLEPWDLAPDFFTLWHNPRLLPHLHMPLQSGSDKILKRMARRTSTLGALR